MAVLIGPRRFRIGSLENPKFPIFDPTEFQAKLMKKIGAVEVIGLLLTVAIAGFCEFRSRDDLPTVAAILGLMAVSSFAFATRGTSGGGAVSAKAEAGKVRSPVDEAVVVGVMNKITGLLQEQAEESKKYAHRLDGANDRLKGMDSSPAVAEIVLALIRDNQEMSGKIETLSENLTSSRTQIMRLQGDLAKAEQVGFRDKVTEIGNRHFFETNLDAELAEARAANGRLCLIIVDIDRFKRVNDTFGHVVGDTLLKLVAELLTRNLKGMDKVARYGGEEFGILLPNTRAADAAIVANNVRKELERKRWVVGRNGQELGAVTASFGVAQFDLRESRDEFVARADSALYRAKQSGRNRVEVAQTTADAEPAGRVGTAARVA
jgi:diguanylate cyclase